MTIESELQSLFERERLPSSLRQVIAEIYTQLASEVAVRARSKATPFIVGLCGAQGSGKSTLAQVLSILLSESGLSTAVVSIDDWYLTRADREILATRVHPLLRTRGVPGTHDVELGSQVLDALAKAGSATLPRFDKARDDRCAETEWVQIATPVDVILFEGWCVGARPQSPSALSTSINNLERDHDPGGIWRRYVNNSLANRYASLFARIDLLVLLQAPSFEVVYRWRREQENKLRERLAVANEFSLRAMNDAELRNFIAHYERLTRHMLNEMPARADIVIRLDEQRNPAQPTLIGSGSHRK